ncbi:MAG: SBBP repeat-containing protein, partial [Chitinophagaceae bacterium]
MRKNQLLPLVISILFSSSFCRAQVAQQWVARFDGPFHIVDQLNSMAVDKAGNVYVTGWSYYDSRSDYTTIKYNEAGEQLWVARYNGPVSGFDDAFAMTVDASGNVYVTGASHGTAGRGDHLYDIATVKYNTEGVQQWVARYDGFSNEDIGRSIAVDGLGNVFVTGYSINPRTGYDYVTIKYNKVGEESWVRRYNGPGNSLDQAFSLVVNASGDVYVTGNSMGSRLTKQDIATIKYS